MITKNDLLRLIYWKFKDLPGRRSRVTKIFQTNSEEYVKDVCAQVLKMNTNQDQMRIGLLDDLEGIGPAIASVILTFYDPKNYCVHDIHVWRELFGEEPSTLFLGSSCYMKVLFETRKMAAKYSLDVRTIEKALFKKNLDEP